MVSETSTSMKSSRLRFFARQTVAADISVIEQWGTHARSLVTGGVRAHAGDAPRLYICSARVQASRSRSLQRVREK